MTEFNFISVTIKISIWNRVTVQNTCFNFCVEFHVIFSRVLCFATVNNVLSADYTRLCIYMIWYGVEKTHKKKCQKAGSDNASCLSRGVRCSHNGHD